MTFSDLLTVVSSGVDWFIPKSLKGDRERMNQARVFLFSHLFGPFLGSAVPFALYLVDPQPGFQVVVLTLSILGFWCFPPLLKRFGHYNFLAIVSVQNLIFCILWSCYWYGGINSPTLPWVLTIPLLAFFYVGPSSTLRTTVIALFSVNVTVFLPLYFFVPPMGHKLPAADLQTLGIISTIAVSLYVTMMAVYYAKVFESQAELESEMREHLQTAVELRLATEEAERAGAAKAEFLAKMSHELRTPLNAVINYSEMLMEDASAEGDQQAMSDLNKINEAGHHLLKLINEILDLSKIDAGMMTVYNEKCDIATLVRNTVDRLRKAAAERNNVIDISIDPQVSPILADQQKMQQTLSQILDNAVKFTKDGLISVHVSNSTTGNQNFLEIAIRDTGIGIAAREMPTLFEQFTVLGDTSSSKYGGTGLGLALSRKLCRLMDGDIKAESTIGQGSCFTIVLPAVQVGASGNHILPAKPATKNVESEPVAAVA